MRRRSNGVFTMDSPPLVFLAIISSYLLPCVSFAEDNTKIAVLDLQAQTKLPEGMVKMLNELMLTVVEESGGLSVIGSSDITSIMTLEEQRVQFTGCVDDVCLAEIGGALGVNLLMVSSIGVLGSNYILNIKLLDTSTANVVKRASEIVEKNDDKLLAALKITVRKVIAPLTGEEVVEEPQASSPQNAEGKTTNTPVTAEPLAASLEAKAPAKVGEIGGFMDYLPWITLGLTGAAAIAGGMMVGLGVSDYEAMDDELKGSKDWEDLGDSSDTKLIAGEVMIGVALAAGAGTLILFLVGGDDETSAQVGLAPVLGGVAATADWTF